jgi:hypothetical protein
MPACWTPVRPHAAACTTARVQACSFSNGGGFGTSRSTSDIACSFSAPVGSPAASFTIVPPGGSGVSRVIPARRSAAVFAHAVWPS